MATAIFISAIIIASAINKEVVDSLPLLKMIFVFALFIAYDYARLFKRGD